MCDNIQFQMRMQKIVSLNHLKPNPDPSTNLTAALIQKLDSKHFEVNDVWKTHK